jgi:hypothetical protein
MFTGCAIDSQVYYKLGRSVTIQCSSYSFHATSFSPELPSYHLSHILIISVSCSSLILIVMLNVMLTVSDVDSVDSDVDSVDSDVESE